MWLDELNITVSSYSNWHINVEVREDNMMAWRFRGLYGHPETQKRKDSWRLLWILSVKSDLPWLCSGDFNELLSKEKKGGANRPRWKMTDFQSAVDDCGLQGLPFEVPMMTWCKRRGSDMVLEWLDRSLANNESCHLFPYSIEEHIVSYKSDYLPLLLKISSKKSQHNGWRKSTFKFENSWCSYEECGNIVKVAWAHSCPVTMEVVSAKLKDCAAGLKMWDKEVLAVLVSV
ncbi:hypothetical protein REPUB_Repub09cG0067800 [Reevesia pubescens]